MHTRLYESIHPVYISLLQRCFIVSIRVVCKHSRLRCTCAVDAAEYDAIDDALSCVSWDTAVHELKRSTHKTSVITSPCRTLSVHADSYSFPGQCHSMPSKLYVVANLSCPIQSGQLKVKCLPNS